MSLKEDLKEQELRFLYLSWFSGNDDLTMIFYMKKSEKIVEGKKKQVIKSMKLSILIEI